MPDTALVRSRVQYLNTVSRSGTRHPAQPIISRIPAAQEDRLAHSSTTRRVAWALTVVALLYSAVHFAQSGVAYPLAKPNLGKFDEETPALRSFMQTGEPVRVDPSIQSVQYGAAFFFVMHPLIRVVRDEHQLAAWLYGLQIGCLAFAFVFTWATLRELTAPRDRLLIAAWLAVLWLNFAPIYMTIATKSVESWELLLLSIALYAYVRGRLWSMGCALAAAALIKLLPLMFFYYLLATNRRAFTRAIAALILMLALGHAIYGPGMGARYLPDMARRAVGASYGLLWHENLSLKAAIAKLFGRLGTPQLDGGHSLRITNTQLRAASLLGDAAVALTVGLLTWTWFRGGTRTTERLIWEWSLVSVVMLLVSPNTTFEYATLALGAMSYALVRIVGSESPLRRTGTWDFVAAMLLLGVLLPRQVLNRLTFIDTLNRLTGYTHLTASEAYQFYCFPLFGLMLLTAALWRLRPLDVPAATVSGVTAV